MKHRYKNDSPGIFGNHIFHRQKEWVNVDVSSANDFFKIFFNSDLHSDLRYNKLKLEYRNNVRMDYKSI